MGVVKKFRFNIWTNGICKTKHQSWRMTHTNSWDFDLQTDHLISARRDYIIIIIIIIYYNNQQNKREFFKTVDFAVPADHRIKLQENTKKDKYFDLVRKLKKMWNRIETLIPIVIGAFGTDTKGLLKELEDLEVGRRVETIQTTTLLRKARILRRVLETWGDLVSLKLQWKTIS